jgi:hypothetical protein
MVELSVRRVATRPRVKRFPDRDNANAEPHHVINGPERLVPLWLCCESGSQTHGKDVTPHNKGSQLNVIVGKGNNESLPYLEAADPDQVRKYNKCNNGRNKSIDPQECLRNLHSVGR